MLEIPIPTGAQSSSKLSSIIQAQQTEEEYADIRKLRKELKKAQRERDHAAVDGNQASLETHKAAIDRVQAVLERDKFILERDLLWAELEQTRIWKEIGGGPEEFSKAEYLERVRNLNLEDLVACEK